MNKNVIIFIIFLCFSSCNSKEKYLTGNSCKFWNVKQIKRRTGEVEKKDNISFKICKNGSVDWFFLMKNGDRKKLNYIGSNLWRMKGDSLFADIYNFEILRITNDSLILRLKGDNIYFKNEQKNPTSRIYEAQSNSGLY